MSASPHSIWFRRVDDSDKLTLVTPDSRSRSESTSDRLLPADRGQLERWARLPRALALAFGAIGRSSRRRPGALCRADHGDRRNLHHDRRVRASWNVRDVLQPGTCRPGGDSAWWFALAPSEQRQPAIIDRLVERSERIMGAELTGLVQEMRTRDPVPARSVRRPPPTVGQAPRPARSGKPLPLTRKRHR